jgi:hypothetical protein
MHHCREEIRDSPLKSVRAALDLFAARIFRYLRCAYKWFRSSTVRKVLGSGNANIYNDLKCQLENIRAAANIFQYKSQEQELTRRLRQLEVISLEDAAKRKTEQQQLDANRLNDLENVTGMFRQLEENLKSEIMLQIGISAKKFLDASVQADLHEPMHRQHQHERYLEGTLTHQLEYTVG